MSEFNGKDRKELERLRAEKREALRIFRFEMSGSKIKNVKLGRALRKSIAQIETAITAGEKSRLPSNSR